MAFLQSLHTSMALCRVTGSPPAALTTSLHSSIANPPWLKRSSFLASALKETTQLIHSPEYESIGASVSESEQVLLDHFQLLDRVDEIPVSRTQHRHQSNVWQLATNCTNQTCNIFKYLENFYLILYWYNTFRKLHIRKFLEVIIFIALLRKYILVAFNVFSKDDALQSKNTSFFFDYRKFLYYEFITMSHKIHVKIYIWIHTIDYVSYLNEEY